MALVLLGLLALSPLTAQPPAPAGPAQAPATLLVNERHPAPGLATGGAPTTPEGFRALAAAGYKTFVDLRGDSEVTPEIQAAVEAAGLAYRRIPISGDKDLHLGTARELASVLAERGKEPVALVCGSGNRVGALLAVKAFWVDGVAPEQALAQGLQGGLTRLEPSVRTLLGLPAATASPQ